jgi:hypothetical protein
MADLRHRTIAGAMPLCEVGGMIAPEKRSYVLNPKSGRPEPPESWPIESLWYWTQGALASGAVIFSLVIAVSGDLRIAASFLALGTLLGAATHRDFKSLRRRKLELKLAETAYDRMLTRH